MAGDDSFTFAPHKPSPLPSQNPLLNKATVTDTTARDQTDAKPVPLNVAASRQRKKVPFQIGYSNADWLRRSKAEAGKSNGARRHITLAEVKQHKTPQDAWTAIRGRVYNLTPYMKFHPGGEKMLMAVAGKDGTAMFNKYHPWVNIEFLMTACFLGLLTQDPEPKPAAEPGGTATAAAEA